MRGKFQDRKNSSPCYHSEKVGDFLHIHQFAKIQVKFANLSFCTEELPLEVGIESHIRFMDRISGVIDCNNTLTLCKNFSLNAFELGNGSWVSYAKKIEVDPYLKKIRGTGEQNALSSFDISDGGLYTEKDLRDSQLSQLMKHTRKTITCRGVFVGQIGEYAHDQLDHFGLKVPPYNCYIFHGL